MERTAKIVCAALVLALPFNRSANAQAPSAQVEHRTEPRTNGPTGFEENKGQVRQTDGRPAPFVKYRLSQGNASIFLLENGMAYQFNKYIQDPDFSRLAGKLDMTPAERSRYEAMKADRRLETFRMDMVLEGADPLARVTTSGRGPDHTNYYNHPAGLEYASVDVHSYQQVVYHDVYPGIDWSLSVSGEGIEQDFIVAPGADPALIKLRFRDHEELFVDEDGRLVHGNRLGRFTEEKPVSWQGSAQVPTNFFLDGDVLAFSIGEYDASRALRIDPPRVWATYYGGTQDDIIQGVDVDITGATYVAGWTYSVNAIASLNGYDLSLSGPPDCMLIKFNQSGQRIWGTYFGGAGEDRFGYCALDAASTYLYASGLSASPGLATVGQTTLGGAPGPWDALLAKFTTVDGDFVWSTFLGGDQEDKARHCATDQSGNVYIAGHTFSDPPPGEWVIASGPSVHQSTYGGGTMGQSYSTGDGFLAKFNSDGSRLWGTYYGGANDDEAYGCATDFSGNVYICGGTGFVSDTSIASPNGHQTVFGLGPFTGGDAYLAKFNPAGVRQWGTYYGGSDDERGYDCTVDIDGNVYLAGITKSTGPVGAIHFGTGHQATYAQGGGDGFLVKFNTGGTRLWGTYHGGTDFDVAYGCETDNVNNVYLTGSTKSTDASAVALYAHQSEFQGDEDAFLAGFDPSGGWVWGTYYGGAAADVGFTVRALTDQFIYLVGQTLSDSPPNGAISQDPGWQTTFGGGVFTDGFLVRFDYRIDCNAEPGGDLQVGTPCDDGDNYTVGDALNEECLCGGTMSCALPIQVTLGENDTEDLSGSILVAQSNRWYRLDISACVDLTLRRCANSNISGLVLGYLYDSCPQGTWDLVTSNTANGCGGFDMTWEDVAPGTYYYEMTVSGSYFGQFITTPCSEVVDCLGVTGGSALPGTPCNDNSACTSNDIWSAECACAGTGNTVTPTVNISANPGGPICAGTNVTFTAAPSNVGGGTVSYQWKLNGANVGSNSANYTNSGLANGNQVSCVIMVTGGSCLSSTTATSNTITMVVTTSITPTVSLVANPAGTICDGTTVVFTATASGTGGGAVTYDFDLNGVTAQNSSSNTWTAAIFEDGDQVVCTITVIGGSCLSTTQAISQTITMDVGSSITPQVSISADPSGAICAGTNVTFTAAPSNVGGGTVSYQWKLNGANVGSNSANYTNSGLANGNQVSCVITITGGSCLSSTTATSNTITMVVTTSITPTVNLAADPAGTICDGTTVVFTATASGTGGGTITYDFDLNGVTAQNNSSNTWTAAIFEDGDQVVCTITVIGGSCLSTTQAISQTITMDVGSSITPQVSISADPSGAICAGTSVTFTAAPSNTGGGSVSYQWKLNGANVGTNSTTYTNAGLANGNQVSCVITVTGGSCLSSTTATSDTITMVVTPLVMPNVSISADPGGAICAGTSVTFTAASGNLGGGTVSYQWRLNGVDVGTNSATYSDASLADADQVSCEITLTGGSCLSSTTATSNIIAMVVTTSITPSVTLVADPAGTICAETTVTFTATASGTGGGDVTYDFDLNGVTAQDGTSNVLNLGILEDGDVVVCTITVSDGACLSTTQATSGTLTIDVASSITPVVSITAEPAGPICASTSVTFTAAPSNTGGGDITYDFQVDDVSMQNGSSSSYTSSALVDGAEVTCVITVADGGCLSSQTATDTETISVNPLPTAFDVNGGGPYCQGEEGLVIGLDDSQSGVEYQLFLDGSEVANVVGNNNAISFPAQTGPGEYTVIAISASECSQQMNGSATITLDSADDDGDSIPNCSDDCPDVSGEFGSPCDDGNDETFNDQLNADCECEGQECSPGNACSDLDDCTINDTWDSGCVCTGVGLVMGPIQGNTLLADGQDYTFAATVFTNDGNMTPVPADQFLWQWSTPDNDWYSLDWTMPILIAHADSSNGPVELCVTASIGSCPAFEACMTVMVVDVGVAENTGAELFSVRPNPSSGRFQVVGDPRVGLLRLTAEDATGRTIPMVTEHSGANRIVDLGDAVPGIYLLRLWHEHGTQVLRLVVRR